MTHRVSTAFARLVRLGLAAFAAVALAAPAPSTLAAQQSTGKIEGTVRDQAGVAIASAQVLLVGTSFGATTNDKGYYFINNVPVGTYTVRAQFIGYAPAELRGIRVLGGQTVTADIPMQSSAVVVTGITVTAAENPIVPRDQVASKTILSGDLVDRLPVDDVRQVISLTPGVVESGAGAGVTIRGGRPGEANVYIDGAPVRGTNSGSQRITIGTNALEEASVTTGALGVEFSDAQSGVIAYTTRAGGPAYSGSLSYESDEPFGNSISVGYNRIEGSFGGPVPRVQNLTFFGSGIVKGQLSDFLFEGHDKLPHFVLGGLDALVPDTADDGTVSEVSLPRYVQFSGECGKLNGDLPDTSALARDIAGNYGFECQGRRHPMNWSTLIQLQGKLQYTYGTGSSVALTGLAQGDQSRNFPARAIGNPQLYSGTHAWQRLAVLNWNHQLFRTAERALSLNLNLSWARDRAITGPLTPESELDSRDPTMGIYLSTLQFNGYQNFPFPITDQIVRNIRSNAGLRVPLLDRTDLENSQPFRVNPYGLRSLGWITSGMNAGGSLLSETRYVGRFVVDWQANRFHRFTLGGDAKKTDLSFWNSGFLRQAFMDAYVVDPVQYGAFASDRLDLGDVVLEVGLRYDYFNSHSLFSKTPGFIFSHPGWDVDAATDDAAYASSLANVFDEAEGHSAISPRLRVSFPVTERTGFRLSYSHQVQTPEFTTLLTGSNNDLSFTNTNDVFGRDLDFGKSILFEFGVRHAFSQDLVLDISAYNKDKVSDYAARIFPFVNPRSSSDTTSINVLTNLDFGNSRGLDTKLDWRVGNYVNTSLAYTFQVSKNTGSDPFTYLNTFARQVSGLTGDRTLPPEQAQRTDHDRTHNIVGAVALSLPSDWRQGTTLGRIARDVSVFASFRAQSGLPYTRLDNNGDGQTVPFLAFGLGGRAAQTLNASILPWTKNVDVRVNKGFRVGRVDFTAYADVRNVLGFKNITGLYAETGDVTNEKFRDLLISPEFTSLADEAGLAQALNADGSIDLAAGTCSNWQSPVNCESLRRVEARFGDGDGIYTVDEQTTALYTFYDEFFGPRRFNGAPRHIRLGLELNF